MRGSKLTIPARRQHRCSTEHRRGEITLPEAGKDDHDSATGHRRTPAEPQCRRNSRSAAHPAEQTLLPGQSPSQLHGLFIIHSDDLINKCLLENRWNKAGPDALNAMRSCLSPERTGLAEGSTAITWRSFCRLRSTRAQPVMVPPVPTPATRASRWPSVSCQISSAVEAA